MAVTLTVPVAGLDRGESYSGPMQDWLVANGYASDGQKTDKSHVTGVKADKDPTLAENREAPGDDVEVLGKGVTDEPEAPVETGEREAEPLPVVNVPFIGAEEDKESTEAREKLDGRVDPDDVSDKDPKVQKDSEKAAEKAAGTGDNLLDEPTSDTAPIKDAPQGEPTPARRKARKDA